MSDRGNLNDECSWAAITSIDDIDKRGLLDYETHQGGEVDELEAEPIAEEEGGRGPVR